MKTKNWKLPAIALFWMFGLGGCIGVPIALPEATPFKELVKSEFVVGETTAHEVDDRLGVPDLFADNWRVYRQSRDGWRWFFCAGAGYTGGCGSTDRTSKDFFLYAGFDETDVLSNVEIFDSDALCDVHRLCFEGELLMRAADPDDDLLRKSFVAPQSGCVAYVYSETGSDSAAGLLYLDGSKFATIVGDSGYIAIDLDPGSHLVAIFPGGASLAGTVASNTIECGEPGIHYFSYRRGLFSVRLENQQVAAGREAVSQRWLAERLRDEIREVLSRWIQDDTIFVAQRGIEFSAHRPGRGDYGTTWAIRYDGEVCGAGIAFEDYGLYPAGGANHFQFASSPVSRVDVVPICNANGECVFPSLFYDAGCKVWQDEKINFTKRRTLLVIEPDGDSYNEVYYGPSSALADEARCEGHSCQIDVAVLRGL